MTDFLCEEKIFCTKRQKYYGLFDNLNKSLDRLNML